MKKENWVEVEYLHKLTEDVRSVGATHIAGIVLARTATPQKLESYSTFNGVSVDKIFPEKVKVYQRTTKHAVEELPVEIMNTSPTIKFIIPKNDPYLSVYQKEESLFLDLIDSQVTIKLDIKILPYLVDALIELQNQDEKQI